MRNLFKNRFMIIMVISVITLVLLIVGAVTLYEDTSLNFSGDGYIISTTTKKNAKYYFSANTKYKRNVDDDVTFKDNDSKDVVVDPASFVHYLDGSVGYLQRGALVNLNEINSSLVNYYNVNEKNLISYKEGNYSFSINGEDVKVNAFIGRISDDKYLIAGNDLYLQVPNKNDRIKGDYFEVLFIEGGVVKIDNQETSYQVTAQDSYIYVGDNIVINLGNDKIYYDGEAKMLLSQITINGDENINLDEIKNSASGGGSGDGSGAGGTGEGESDDATEEGEGEGTGEGSGEGTGEGEGEGTGEGSGGGSGEGEGEGDGTGEGSGGSGSGGSGSGEGTLVTDDSARVEIVQAEVSSTVIDLSLQLNNAGAISGTLRASLTNVGNGERVYEQDIPAVNGTFKVRKESLSPDTDYALAIYEVGKDNEKRYFQKTFRTKVLGVILEKNYTTSDSLAYGIVFDENTDATKVRVTIYDSNGSNEDISPNSFVVSKSDLLSVIEFSGLKSNSSYSVLIDSVWIDNAAYSDVYNISRIDNTLKQTPTLSGLEVTTNSEEVRFNIKLNNVKDPDKAILSYTYNFYLADDITLDNPNPEPIYSVVKNDSDALDINLNDIAELKAGIGYRCKIVAQYDDNEMIREVSTDYSSNFLVKSRPNVSFEQLSVSVSEITGIISLVDANCTIPVAGRACSNVANDFILRYYKMGEDETADNDTKISFDGTSLNTKISITGLSSATTYAFKVFGNYIDDDGNIHKNVQLGDTFYVKTDESETLKFKVIGDNISGHNKNGEPNSANVVTFDAVLQSPQDEQHKVAPEDISSITLNLYNGSYNKVENLIGNYVIKDKNEIADFFSNYNVTNSLFTNKEIGKLDSLQKMIQATNNSIGTLNGTYTVEVAKVLYPDGITQYKVEDPIYTFKLTPEYYLDSRIESNPQYSYINVTKIKKEDLTEDEYEELSKKISNLDELNDDTYVGVTIENSLSDTFVDSAFTYENVNVVFQIKNKVTNKIITKDEDYLLDMDNKYQPSSVTIYLDSIDKENKNAFTRGYNYEFSYKLQFETEDGRDPEYTNDKLALSLEYKREGLDNSLYRQSPIYTMYISSSTANSVTYRYKISDIDNTLNDKKLYYNISGEDTKEVKEEFVVDNEFHDITVPIDERTKYSVCFSEKRSNGKTVCKLLSTELLDFESEYDYDNTDSFTVSNDYNNTLKISLKNNDITNRAAAYKVSIKALDDSKMKTYVRYFLSSQLFTEDVDTGQIDEDGAPIVETIKYIAIDYASISDYMMHDLSISVDCYYDSGLVGINQKFPNGLILENKVKANYLNIYNGGSNDTTTDSVESNLNGIYMIRGSYEVDATNIHLYNHLQDSNPNLPDSNTKKYNPLVGVSYYSTSNVDSTIGKNYELTFTSEGINFGNHGIFNPKVLKVASLKSSDNNYRFDSIIPRVSLDTSGSTINSISLKVNCSGVYGQFVKDSQPHNKFYLEIYSDQELTNKLQVLESDITIENNVVDAEVVTLENLVPATTYYVAIYAYLDGRYTRLYDSANKKAYVFRTYQAKTLNASGILKRIDFLVNPVSYNYDEDNEMAYPSNKELRWKLRFNNTKNFKVRFELYDIDGNPVNFDGTSGVNCNTELNGDSSKGYVNGCYISVDKDSIDKINDVEYTYSFGGDNFVFGDGYYKLIVYAVPYTNSSYDYDNQLIIYQNDSLSNNNLTTVDGIMYKITIPTLKEATFDVLNYKSECVSNSCSVSFVPSVIDSGKVIKGGKYSITLKYENNVVETLKMDANTIGNNLVTFDNLSSATKYELEFSYEANINNNGYTDAQKNYMAYILNEISTAVENDIVLGEVTAQASGTQKIILSYHGSYNLSNKIVQVVYTVRPLGESSNASGTINLVNGNGNFEVQGDKILKLTLDLSSSSITLKSGNTYNIYMDYYYKDAGGQLVKLGGKSFTTRLSL